MTVDEILISARQAGASDIHMVADEQPMMRVRGCLEPMNLPRFGVSQILDMLIQLLSQGLREHFEETGYCISTYEASDGQRYRVNAYRQRGTAALAIRIVGDRIPASGELPERLLEAARTMKGLILIAGRPGSGRTTTLAALGQYLGNEKHIHMMTVGYTVEQVIHCEGSVVSQRTLAQDVPNPVRAIEEAGRMDADVLLLDVLEAREDIWAAVKAAANGILVVAVVNCGTAGGAVQELLDRFPLAERGDMERQMRRLSVLEVYQEFDMSQGRHQVRYYC